MKYILLVLLVISCASHRSSMSEGGTFAEKKIGDHTYHVTFAGGENTTPDQVKEMLHYRCAQLALKNGYKYFAVLSDQEKVEHHLPINGKFAVSDDEFIHSAKILFSTATIPGKQNYDAEEVVRDFEK